MFGVRHAFPFQIQRRARVRVARRFAFPERRRRRFVRQCSTFAVKIVVRIDFVRIRIVRIRLLTRRFD